MHDEAKKAVGRAGEGGSACLRVQIGLLGDFVSAASGQARRMHLSSFRTDGGSRLQAEAGMTFCERPRYAVDARRWSEV
jgi:hypothetical protein